jgi:hypothetical protein
VGGVICYSLMAQRAHKANLLAAIRGGILNKKESVSCANFRGDAPLLAHLRQAGLIYGYQPSGPGRLVIFLKLGEVASLRREQWKSVPKLSARQYSVRLLKGWQRLSRRRET